MEPVRLNVYEWAIARGWRWSVGKLVFEKHDRPPMRYEAMKAEMLRMAAEEVREKA